MCQKIDKTLKPERLVSRFGADNGMELNKGSLIKAMRIVPTFFADL